MKLMNPKLLLAVVFALSAVAPESLLASCGRSRRPSKKTEKKVRTIINRAKSGRR
jgi:hypothetical protein